MLIELFFLVDLTGLERGREERGLSLKLYVPGAILYVPNKNQTKHVSYIIIHLYCSIIFFIA